jgi:Tfp pilus assembly protein PilW
MAGIFVLQVGGQRAYLFGSNRVETQQNARVALDLITRELRSASSVTSLDSATDITFGWKDELDAAHTIQYALAGTTLNRTFDGVTTPLIGGVRTLVMTYYSAFDPTDPTTPKTKETTDAALVKVIKISVETGTEEAVATGSAGDARAIMESTVTLRSST